MSFDLHKWLTEDMRFSADEAKEIMGRFTPERIETLSTGYVGPAQRKALEQQQTELAAARQKLDADNERFNAELKAWGEMSAEEQSANEGLRKELEAAQLRSFQSEQRLTALAVKHGVDPKTVLPEGAPVEPKKPTHTSTLPEGFDPKKFVPVEHFQTMSRFSVQLPAKLMSIAREHHALTGEDLDTEALTTEIMREASKADGNPDPRAIWERTHDIAAKRVAKQKADFDAQISAAEARGEERARSSSAMPPASVPGRHAPIFGSRSTEGGITARQSVLKRPQPETGLRAAAAALASGKYRQRSA